MSTGIHQGGLPRLFPYHYLIEQEKNYYLAKAAYHGYVDLAPCTDLIALCQQVIDIQGGTGSFMLKDLTLPAGLTYDGTMLIGELYIGILTHYTNGVPQSGTAYSRIEQDGSITRNIIIAGKEIILDTETPNI